MVVVDVGAPPAARRKVSRLLEQPEQSLHGSDDDDGNRNLPTSEAQPDGDSPNDESNQSCA